MRVPRCLRNYPLKARACSYDYETFLPPSTNGNGGLNFIGMQRCLDCDSSPIAELANRQKQNGFSTLFTLNEPDINGITPQQAADWYKQNINPMVCCLRFE